MRARVLDAGHRDGAAHSRDEGSVMEFRTEGAALFSSGLEVNQQWEEPSWLGQSRCSDIPEAGSVGSVQESGRVNQGAQQALTSKSIADFEADLTNNLVVQALESELSSGSYHPPPVRRVDIPKGEGGQTRPLGIPTVADRIAQTVVKRYLEPLVEPCFHPDSYGYRPGKSALDAVGVARQRCWRYAWVLDSGSIQEPSSIASIPRC